MTTLQRTFTTAYRTFVQRIGYLTPCVIPADLLSNEPTDAEDPSTLRADASQDGLSFVQVLRALEEGLYQTRVAASPDRVHKGYTVLLTEQQLCFALPWEARLEWENLSQKKKRGSASILALLREHAAEVQPLAQGIPMYAPAPLLPVGSLTLLDTVEVSTEDLREALTQVKKQSEAEAFHARRRLDPFHLQQVLLQVMIDTLMRELYQAQERASALTLKARCVLLAQLQRWHRSTRQERLVRTARYFSQERHQTIWRLTVGLPMMA